MTLLYPLLVEAGMERYFKINDGVSYRPRQGMWPQPPKYFIADYLELQMFKRY